MSRAEAGHHRRHAVAAVTTNLNGTGIRVAQAEAMAINGSTTIGKSIPAAVGQPASSIHLHFQRLVAPPVFPIPLATESGHAEAVGGIFLRHWPTVWRPTWRTWTITTRIIFNNIIIAPHAHLLPGQHRRSGGQPKFYLRPTGRSAEQQRLIRPTTIMPRNTTRCLSPAPTMAATASRLPAGHLLQRHRRRRLPTAIPARSDAGQRPRQAGHHRARPA